jgi:DNA-binding MarR family transcriptional regulator
VHLALRCVVSARRRCGIAGLLRQSNSKQKAGCDMRTRCAGQAGGMERPDAKRRRRDPSRRWISFRKRRLRARLRGRRTDFCRAALVAVEKMGSKVESKRIGGQDALRREADAARRDGFSAKAAIHPSQMEVINRCFSELSDAADVDKAAASRSLAVLADRGLISIEQTRSRGRAAIAKLTREGRDFATRMAEASRKGRGSAIQRFLNHRQTTVVATFRSAFECLGSCRLGALTDPVAARSSDH